MRNIVLSIVIVASLVAAGIGGTFADFSDIEVSPDNYFKIGSLDLTVSDYTMTEYNGDAVPAFIQYKDAWPCSDKSYFIDLENWGQGVQYVPWAYMHVKNVECVWVYPKLLYMWVNPDGTEADPATIPDPPDPAVGWIDGDQGQGFPKPVTEPEYVAEFGGLAGELPDGTLVVVPGIGPYGEHCELPDHITVEIEMAGPWPHEVKPPASLDLNWQPVWAGPLRDLECTPLELGQIPNCNGIWLHIVFHLEQPQEEDFQLDEFPGTDLPWNCWVTNALQKDGVHFDMAFEIFQNRLP